MNNWQEGLKATNTALNSQGSATRENEKYLQSFEAKINKLKNTFTELSSAVGEAFLSDAMISIFGLFENLLKIGVKLSNTFGVLPTIFVPLGLVFSKFGILKSVNQNFERLISNTQAYQKMSVGLNNSWLGKEIGFDAVNKGVKKGSLQEVSYEKAQEMILNKELISSEEELQQKYANKGNVLLKVAKATEGEATATRTLTTANEVVTGATVGFTSALRGLAISTGIGLAIAGVGWAIEKLVSVYVRHKKEQEELEKQNNKMIDSYYKFQDTINGTVDRYESLSKAMKNGKISTEGIKEYESIQNKLVNNFPTLLDYIDANGKKHLKSAEEIRKELEATKELAIAKAELNEENAQGDRKSIVSDINSAKSDYEKAKRRLTNGKSLYNSTANSEEKALYKTQMAKYNLDVKEANSQLTTSINASMKKVQEQTKNALTASGVYFKLTSSQKTLVDSMIANNIESLRTTKDEDAVMASLKEKATHLGETLSGIAETMIPDDASEKIQDNVKQKVEGINKIVQETSTFSKHFFKKDKEGFDKEVKDLFSVFENLDKTPDGSKNDEIIKQFEKLKYSSSEAKAMMLAYANVTNNAKLKEQILADGIDEETESLADNMTARVENSKAIDKSIWKKQDEIKSIKDTIAQYQLLKKSHSSDIESQKAYERSMKDLESEFPQFSGHISENIDEIMEQTNVMGEVADKSDDLQLALSSTDGEVRGLSLSILENSAIYKLCQSSMSDLLPKYSALGKEIDIMKGKLDGATASGVMYASTVLAMKQAEQGKVGLEISDYAQQASNAVKAIKSALGSFDNATSKSGSGTSNTLADLFKVDTLERQHKAYESVIDSLNAKLQSLNKNSQEYRNTLQSILDYELQNMAIEKQQIAQMESRNGAIQSRLSALSNVKKHSKAQRDEYNDLQKEYEDNLDKIASLNKDIQSVLNEIKEKSLEIFNDFIDEIVNNYETAIKKIQDSIDNTEFKISVQGLINPDNMQELLNLQIQKALDAQKEMGGKQDEVNSLNTAYNNAVAQYGGNSDQAKRALEELNKAKEELEDAMIGVLQAEKDIQDTRAKVADEAIDALKDYYKNVEDMALDAIDKEKEQFQKLHDDKLKAYDEEIEAINKVYDTKFKEMDKEKSESDYQAELNEKNAKKTELVNKITLLSKDNSKTGLKSLADAKKELADLDKEIEKFQSDRQFELTKQGLEDQKQAQLDAIDAKKTAEDEALQSSLDNLDKQKEAISKHYEDLINNDAYWAKLRDDAIKGSFTLLNTELSNMKQNLDDMNLGIFDSLTSGIDGVSVKFGEMSQVVKDEINKVDSLLVDNLLFNLQNPLADILGMVNAIGYTITNAGIQDAFNAGANATTNLTTYVPPAPTYIPPTPTPQETAPTVSYYPATSYGGSSIVDALKSIGVPSDMNTRTKIASKNGISGYSGSAIQNMQLLTLLKQGRLMRFMSGGYTNDWIGNEGKLAILDKKEQVLNAKDTLNLFNTMDLLNKNILPTLKSLNLAKSFVESGQASAITNNTILNFNIDKVVGTEKGAEDFADVIMNKLKKRGK